jgi:uncharacterized repeat protein (TIGR03803 family)
MTLLHHFRPDLGDGGSPNGPLLQASDGNIYGTAASGGINLCRPESPVRCGVIFKLTPDGTESVLYHFGSTLNDGYMPYGPLIQAQDGALYGLTARGGDQGGGGTAFKITLDGTYTVLHSFGGTPDDGIVPLGGLIQATDGNFYGVTSSGGANHCFQIPQAGGNCGTVFRMTPSGEVTTLHSFGASITDGVTPLASLVQASDGNFYGTTVNGGANACSTAGGTNNCGTVFRITPDGETTILHSFGPTRFEAIGPMGTLVQGTDGLLYGTTVSGGGGECNAVFACGTVFKMTLDGELSIVYAFSRESTADGNGPSQYLFQDSDGNFYGTTGSGGANGAMAGTAFRLTPAGVLTTLYSFGPMDFTPANPRGGPTKGLDGALYVPTTYSEAYSGAGSVVRLVLP